MWLVLAVATIAASLWFAWRRSWAQFERNRAEIRGKQRLRDAGGPIKQKAVSKWVVLSLDLGLHEDWRVDDNYRLEVVGCNGSRVSLSLNELVAMAPRETREPVDWVCVTGWTRHGLELWGVPLSAITSLIGDGATGTYCIQTSADGYASQCFTEDLDDAFLCLGLVNEETGERELLLPREHGVIRLVAPKLFGWKSAKWLTKVEFVNVVKQRGFWERLGCHERGRVAEDERWAPGNAALIWPVLIRIHDSWTRCGLYWIMMTLGAKILSVLVWLRVVRKTA
jgi:DMSO/TMAO reductase YedYZ molybdopterin-dependent catalytic subunit